METGRPFLHTLYTWLLALLIVLLVTMLCARTNDYSEIVFTYAIGLWVAGVVIALPCLAIGFVCLKLILRSPISVAGKFCLWLLVIALLIIGESVVLELITFREIEPDTLGIILLISMSGLIAALIRYGQFENLVHLTQTGNDETNLV